MSDPYEPVNQKAGAPILSPDSGPSATDPLASTAREAPPIRLADIQPGTSFRDAALAFYAAGFAAIPVVPGTKRSAVKWDDWLSRLSSKTIQQHWLLHRDHELGVILDARMLVLDADTQLATTALDILETKHGIRSNLVVRTRRGQHRYYQLAEGVFAKTNAHSTEAHPERIDVKAARSFVVLPPSTNKEVEHCAISSVPDLTVVDQAFVDAVYVHNGLEPPRAAPTPTVRLVSAGVNADRLLAGLRAKLSRLDPDMGYSGWLAVQMAVHHETGGSEEGFQLVNEWSSRGEKYCGENTLRSKWNSFAGHVGPEMTVGTINAMLTEQGDDWQEIEASVEPQFEVCGFEIIEPAQSEDPGNAVGQMVSSVLARYSIVPHLDELRREELAQQFVLDGIALMGQATVLYAAPNTGKTLLVFWMLIEAIKKGRIDPAKLYYLNCDDGFNGLLTKGAIANTYGFHMLADGYQGFEASKLREILLEVMESGQARGTVIVLDTLKKFTDLMEKHSSAQFMKIMRRYVLKGGTVIMLAHTNKKPGPDGKPVYEGVSDILNDADCAYTLWITSEAGAAEKVVEFEMKKRRGNVLQQATFAYSGADKLSYEQLFASVRRVDGDEAVKLHVAAIQRADDPIIEAAKASIQDGVCKRLELVAEVARRTNCGRRTAETVLDKYTGGDPLTHHWNYRIGPRGAKLFYLLDVDPSDDKPEDKSPDY